jgi:hypothetical protein
VGAIFLLFGPVSSATSNANSPGENIVWGVFVALAFCWLLTEIWNSNRRVRNLRAAVRLRRWDWLGSELPRDFPLRELAKIPNREVQIKNAFCGQQRGLYFFSCDCVIDEEAENQHWFSIVAARTDKNPFGAERFDTGLSIVQVNGWFAIQRAQKTLGFGAPVPGNKLFSLDEVIGHIDSLS